MCRFLRSRASAARLPAQSVSQSAGAKSSPVLGWFVGLGVAVGTAVGTAVGAAVGAAVGSAVGVAVGSAVGVPWAPLSAWPSVPPWALRWALPLA